MLRRFFFRYIIFIVSFPCLPSLIFTSCPSPSLFSSLLFTSSSLLPVVFRCLCCVSVLRCCRISSILCCRRFVCFVLSLVAAALLRCCRWLLRGCPCRCWWCCCFSFRPFFFFRSFCSFSLSLRPLLSSRQVHSARRVACTWAGHHDDGWWWLLKQFSTSFFLISHLCATFASWVVAVDWAVQNVAQLHQWFEEGRRPREMCAMRPDWSLESIKTKLEQLRRDAPDESRPLKRRRTREVLAEIETAVNERPRQTLSVLRRHSSLDTSRSTLWRALHEDLQAQCFKPVRAPRLTKESHLARLNFCRDVLQRVGVLSVLGNRYLQPLDLTRVEFSDEKAPAWTMAQATDCNLESHSRKSTSVWSPCLGLLLSLCLSLFLSLSLSLSPSLSPSPSPSSSSSSSSSSPIFHLFPSSSSSS